MHQLEAINGLVILPSQPSDLASCEAVISRGLASFVEVGQALLEIRESKLYREVAPTFEAYLAERWPDLGGRRHAYRIIDAAQTVEILCPIGHKLPATETQARPLTGLPPEEQIETWQRVIVTAGDDPITAALVARTVKERKAERAASVRPSRFIEPSPTEQPAEPLELAVQVVPETLPAVAETYLVGEWKALRPVERRWLIEHASDGQSPSFNRTNNNVEWALWTWNPVTGCDHGCDYCYARDIAVRHYSELPVADRFAPVFRPTRLHAPRRMHVPAAHDPADPSTIGEKNVFVCSMADLFGKWVPQEWIDAVFQEVVRASSWNFLFLTKFPQRLAAQDWPSNAWVGTTVDRQNRVSTAERSFSGVKAGVKWLSCEPLLERLTFNSLEMFDWVVIGASSRSTQTPEFQPPWEWVEHLMAQARAAGCKVYIKPNLKSRPQEYPGEFPVAPPVAKLAGVR